MSKQQMSEAAYTVSRGEVKWRNRLSAALLVGLVVVSYVTAKRLQETQRAVAAAQLQASREALRLKLIVTSEPVAIMMCDEGGTILLANPATEEITGWSPDEITGQPAECIVPEDQRAAHSQGMEEAAEAIKNNRGDWLMLLRDAKFTVLRKDGSLRDISASIRVIKFMGEVEFIMLMRPINGEQQRPGLVPLPDVSASTANRIR